MDYQKSFTYQFEDPDWLTKLGLGMLISLVPILNFAWMGYMVEIVRNVMSRQARPLTTWDDLGKKFTEGLMLGLAGLVYMLPALLLMGIPLMFLITSGVLSGAQDLRSVSETLAGAGGLMFPLVGCVIVIYGLAYSFIHPAILLVYSEAGTFASCFNFNRILGVISRNSGSYLGMWAVTILGGLLVTTLVSTVGGLVGWIPCIGWIIAIVLTFAPTIYLSSVQAHLVGQFGGLAGQ